MSIATVANPVANMASSGSLTTADTTKGSDFCSQGFVNSSGSSNTPQRAQGSLSILNDSVVPPRPTNTSRVVSSLQNSSTRKHRSLRGGVETLDGNLFGAQGRASQTSMGSNSFVRSAMRLKQQSGRNGIPHRGGSLDGSNSSNNQVTATDRDNVSGQSMISRAGRTAGGAMWSRMLNMQSVEEGI